MRGYVKGRGNRADKHYPSVSVVLDNAFTREGERQVAVVLRNEYRVAWAGLRLSEEEARNLARRLLEAVDLGQALDNL